MVTSGGKLWLLVTLLLACGAISLQASQLDEDPRAVTLPLDLEVNGSRKGAVIIRSTSNLDIVELQIASLRERIQGSVPDEVAALIARLPDGFVALETLRERGIEVALDLERLVIVLSLPERVDFAAPQPRRIRLGYQQTLQRHAHAPEAAFSGYANFRWRSRRSERDGIHTLDSNALGISHVLNFKGYALEGESVWNDQDGFAARELRMVKDLPDRLLRLSAGDVFTPIVDLQGGYQLLGVNVAKEFDLQPYRSFTPTGSASFRLEESSTVHVTVNGRPVKTLRLQPGQYDIEEFKLAAGQNDMELRIDTDSGLTDTLSVSHFGSYELLEQGVSTYSFAFGWPRAFSLNAETTEAVGLDWYQRIVEREPIYSAYFRKGLTNRYTASINAQGSAAWSRLGMSVTAAPPEFGLVNLQLGYNQGSGNPGAFSSRLSWRYSIGGYSLSMATTRAQPGFSLRKPDQQIGGREFETVHSLTVSKLFRESVNASLSLLEQKRQDGERERSLNGRVGKRFGPVYANASIRVSESPRGDDRGGYLTLTWSPANKWRARSEARYDNGERGAEVSTSLDYFNRRADDYTSATINARYGEGAQALDGGVSYYSSLYSVSAYHTESYDFIDDFSSRGRETAFVVESAVAFAGNSVGLARRIHDSFAIIDRHPAWSNVTIGVNPTLGGFEKESGPSFLRPVLFDLNSYRESHATIQTINSSLFLENNDFYFFPSYRRGTRVVIGTEYIYSVRSTLLYADGSPVAYKALRFNREDKPTVTGFTNAVGRFVVTGLMPGRYTITVADTQETGGLVVEEGAEGETMVFLESVRLEAP